MTDNEILQKARDIKTKRLEVMSEFLSVRKIAHYVTENKSVECIIDEFTIDAELLSISISLTPTQSQHEQIRIEL